MILKHFINRQGDKGDSVEFCNHLGVNIERVFVHVHIPLLISRINLDTRIILIHTRY